MSFSAHIMDQKFKDQKKSTFWSLNFPESKLCVSSESRKGVSLSENKNNTETHQMKCFPSDY